jgi:hypothetical protein
MYQGSSHKKSTTAVKHNPVTKFIYFSSQVVSTGATPVRIPVRATQALNALRDARKED